MILSDVTLKKMIDSGELIVKPIKKESIQPASIDCHLGKHYLTIEDRKMSVITLDSPIQYREISSNSITIPAHSFLLATTEEYIKLPADVTAFVEGRSSIGRIGLFIQNAGWVDPGFEGRITLELYNANSLPIKLQSGRRICQLVFCKMDQSAKNPYAGKYQGQVKSIGSRIYQDKELKLLKIHPVK
ncbi:MAG: dCTP deaminase [Candidatus Staskawiczbacteria bacterium RIFCSPLOWO2_01_FULL_40_39]|uniref:dCTP deaminase, dUMP-forming n=1 Tax=Candidatus Staskawiczbacteria bacterium RIFCSPHIGHO2_01_FULL_39_25 TaxID=1802202 RepID=A0A1G2HMU9_9BACT|nr:MAG: dCTP deaminase [Candidatus Staskawiczbacteria bacterium RIFCSPHIGHO2_01_FULL_39_25]OGZ73312.1 MAG: dCTP deaminase [Candidatus Staskawiczbacteria bacterium RIFCSPLOWO2_01_FULL_40_39]OGZ75064.1 MAG: dCTP deaminase [Candidatus Staskawiczbacteria bacterium RIFCSPLOWO2_02_FULL_39_8]